MNALQTEKQNMTYRLLTPDEWPKLEPLFGDEPLPVPQTSVVAIAENEDDEILGVFVLQLQWHLEPLIIKNPKVNFLRLKEVLDNQLRPHGKCCYYSFVDDARVAKMAERAGLRAQPWLVFKGEV